MLSAKIVLEGSSKANVFYFANRIEKIGGRFDQMATSMGPKGKDIQYVINI